MDMAIRDVRLEDAQAICDIYNHYIRETTITFEEQELSLTDIQQRIETISAGYPYLVYESAGRICGYAYGNFWRTRSAYRYTTETTIYLDHRSLGKGVGRELYKHLLERLRQAGFHVAMGVIGLPNIASETLHQQMGFHRAGLFTEVGKKFGEWRDVAYWELKL